MRSEKTAKHIIIGRNCSFEANAHVLWWSTVATSWNGGQTPLGPAALASLAHLEIWVARVPQHAQVGHRDANLLARQKRNDLLLAGEDTQQRREADASGDERETLCN